MLGETKRGRVVVQGERRPHGQPTDLILNWKEFGGPPVATPEKSSFGTSTIRDLIPYEFGGRVVGSGGTPNSEAIARAS